VKILQGYPLAKKLLLSPVNISKERGMEREGRRGKREGEDGHTFPFEFRIFREFSPNMILQRVGVLLEPRDRWRRRWQVVAHRTFLLVLYKKISFPFLLCLFFFLE
jgi:hypothetical protein